MQRFRSRALDDDELLSEAMYTLSRAVERFSPWKGFRFSTYATHAILRTLVRREKREIRYRRLFPVQCEAVHEEPADIPDTSSGLYVERLRRILAHNVGSLSPVESLILARRFPFDGKPPLTLEEVGGPVGLTKERVRQIQNTALRKLRNVLAEDPVLR